MDEKLTMFVDGLDPVIKLETRQKEKHAGMTLLELV